MATKIWGLGEFRLLSPPSGRSVSNNSCPKGRGTRGPDPAASQSPGLLQDSLWAGPGPGRVGPGADDPQLRLASPVAKTCQSETQTEAGQERGKEAWAAGCRQTPQCSGFPSLQPQAQPPVLGPALPQELWVVLRPHPFSACPLSLASTRSECPGAAATNDHKQGAGDREQPLRLWRPSLEWRCGWGGSAGRIRGASTRSPSQRGHWVSCSVAGRGLPQIWASAAVWPSSPPLGDHVLFSLCLCPSSSSWLGPVLNHGTHICRLRLAHTHADCRPVRISGPSPASPCLHQTPPVGLCAA